MDHADWLDEPTQRELAATLAQQVAPGGRVIWRSAALCPPYAKLIEGKGGGGGGGGLEGLIRVNILGLPSFSWL